MYVQHLLTEVKHQIHLLHRFTTSRTILPTFMLRETYFSINVNGIFYKK